MEVIGSNISTSIGAVKMFGVWLVIALSRSDANTRTVDVVIWRRFLKLFGASLCHLCLHHRLASRVIVAMVAPVKSETIAWGRDMHSV